jgi:hypothetical protein
MLAINGRDHPSWSIGDALTRRDTPIWDDGCIHQATSAPAITKRMVPSWRGGHPYGLKDAAMGHEGCTHPADRGHPSALMAIGKQARGCALWPGGQWPCGLMDTRKQAHGGTPFASCGHPWALMVTRKRREGCIARGEGLRPSGRIDSSERGEGAPLRGSREAMRPHRRADEPEGSSDQRRGLLDLELHGIRRVPLRPLWRGGQRRIDDDEPRLADRQRKRLWQDAAQMRGVDDPGRHESSVEGGRPPPHRRGPEALPMGSTVRPPNPADPIEPRRIAGGSSAGECAFVAFAAAYGLRSITPD